jgi:hypothetical protein
VASTIDHLLAGEVPEEERRGYCTCALDALMFDSTLSATGGAWLDTPAGKIAAFCGPLLRAQACDEYTAYVVRAMMRMMAAEMELPWAEPDTAADIQAALTAVETGEMSEDDFRHWIAKRLPIDELRRRDHYFSRATSWLPRRRPSLRVPLWARNR